MKIKNILLTLCTSLLLTNVAAHAKEVKIGMAIDDLRLERWQKDRDIFVKKAESLGAKVFVQSANGNEETQMSQIENMINRGVDVLVIIPYNGQVLSNVVKEAKQEGIKVLAYDRMINDADIDFYISFDNEKVGEKGANYIMEQLKDGGEVAIIEGKAGNASGEYRKNGATTAFTANSAFKLVASQPADWDRQKALDTAASMIQKYPNLKAIYCCNDTMALGALQAVKNANKLGKIMVVGTDGAAEAIDSVKAGELSATVAQDSAGIGAVSLKTMVETVKAGKAIDVNATPETIPVDSYIVTKDS